MEQNFNDSNYWKKRALEGAKVLKESRQGRRKAIESPEQLWQFACEYFERQVGSPWKKTDFKGKDADQVYIPTSAPFLWSGLDDYLFEKGIITSLKDYRTGARNPEYKDGRYKDFAEVIHAIDEIMSGQKIAGAMVGAYNSNLVARLEGLTDKTETEVTVKETKIGYD